MPDGEPFCDRELRIAKCDDCAEGERLSVVVVFCRQMADPAETKRSRAKAV
jgi:hypothetical protein